MVVGSDDHRIHYLDRDRRILWVYEAKSCVASVDVCDNGSFVVACWVTFTSLRDVVIYPGELNLAMVISLGYTTQVGVSGSIALVHYPIRMR